MRDWWKRKGFGRFSGESSARSSEKGAGACSGAQKSWGHLWEISTTPGMRSPSLLLQEGMLTKSSCKLQKLGLGVTRERQVETALVSEHEG